MLLNEERVALRNYAAQLIQLIDSHAQDFTFRIGTAAISKIIEGEAIRRMSTRPIELRQRRSPR